MYLNGFFSHPGGFPLFDQYVDKQRASDHRTDDTHRQFVGSADLGDGVGYDDEGGSEGSGCGDQVSVVFRMLFTLVLPTMLLSM